MVEMSENDLAARSYYFRNSLIEEFRLSESDTCSAHKNFSSFVIGTILVNAIVLGIQTSMDEIEDWRMVQTLEVLDNCTMVIFVWEIVLKWIANFRSFWRDGWNVFDFLVTAGVLVPMLAQALMGSEDQSNAQNFASVAKNLRIFRTFRTLKMIAKFRSLRIIVRTVMEALQSLGFVLILLCLLMYIFAVLAIGLFSDYSNSTMEGLEYTFVFSDMIAAVRTLFQLLTLDQWYNIAKEISDEGETNMIVTISFFVVWVALGAFIFRNIFIGVMVKNFQSISQELADLDQMSRKRARMRKYVKNFQQQMEEKKREIEHQMIHGKNSSSNKNGRASSASEVENPSINSKKKESSAIMPSTTGSLLRQMTNTNASMTGQPLGGDTHLRAVIKHNLTNDTSPKRPHARQSFAIPKAWIADGVDPLTLIGSKGGGEQAQGTSPASPNSAGGDGRKPDLTVQTNDLSPTKQMQSPQTSRWADSRLSKFYDAAKADEWKRFVQQSLTVFGEQDAGSTLWPRDTLLHYLQTMEKLQENLKEHHELQHLATEVLYSIATDG
ncbi:Sodium channel protein type 10 subunit alpha [Hondaea fermentalgiana]|uniref:Sodium channel protein type 10 subunit alpha n=1 Tax=Hondaea fermentalgiana TaxID=2315210 RepID=A0A2R5GLS1_9STRA|nr:Sodium channel protein type 10 subunit alpha [Hondaea fermentalgiana]|eukprot:GBG31846.1 Sodium channel protein type 10 subunit alpha [Hondaea fermentalgiana]